MPRILIASLVTLAAAIRGIRLGGGARDADSGAAVRFVPPSHVRVVTRPFDQERDS